LPVANGGTGTATAFTPGSVVFAGASGVYTQDNNNLFWDDTNNRLGVGFVPVVTFGGILTLGSVTITLTTTAVCTVDATLDMFVPAGTVVREVNTASSVIVKYGTGVTGNTLASALQALPNVAILTATATVDGGLTLPSGFYATTTVASSSRAMSSTLNVGTTGQFQVSPGGDIVAIRGQTTTFPASNASGVLTNNGSGTLSWATVGVANGGTNLSSYAVGDLIYASGTTTLAKLADIATGNALISGGVGVAPSWGKIGIGSHVSGLGTSVATALAVNVGSAGAVVVNGGAPDANRSREGQGSPAE
jgi:hypothetical protein